MKKEINPRETSRAAAFELWMSSPMPMVTLTKTFDVSRILKISRKRGMEIQYDLVLGDRLCCIENQGVLSSSGKNIRLILANDAAKLRRRYESDFNITEFFPDKFCFFQR